MAEAIDIRELNIRIEQQSAFVTNLVAGMDRCWRVCLAWLKPWQSRRSLS